MKKLARMMTSMVAGLFADLHRLPEGKSFQETPDPIRRSQKSSGGSGARRRRIVVSEKKAWRKVFGGVAVPAFGIELLPPLYQSQSQSAARGPRPNTFYKMTRMA